ncbi:hypothetical protein ACSRUE_20150 [Sorangium sp. KYC3313]|uniref:hypothetical protein n=1 Tax=Sorangium sp. KYC3313 TaxID=3449740 RepID=UPI003F88DA35
MMGIHDKGADTLGSATIELEDVDAAPAAEAGSRLSIDDLLPQATSPEPAARAAPAAAPSAGTRTARVLDVAGRSATIVLRGATAPFEAELAPEVDPEVIADAQANGDLVLVECCEGEAPLVVAALTTRKPREIRLQATTVSIEAEEEVLLRSGHGAVRIRQDGDIEVIGSRISAASRGLFRLVGRILRLN